MYSYTAVAIAICLMSPLGVAGVRYGSTSELCCRDQLASCHYNNAADGCVWSNNRAICVNNPINSQNPKACAGMCNDYGYVWQVSGAESGDCICTNLDPNGSEYCVGESSKGTF